MYAVPKLKMYYLHHTSRSADGSSASIALNVTSGLGFTFWGVTGNASDHFLLSFGQGKYHLPTEVAHVVSH